MLPKLPTLLLLPLLALVPACDDPNGSPEDAFAEDDERAEDDEDDALIDEAIDELGAEDPTALSCGAQDSYTNTVYSYTYNGFAYTYDVHKTSSGVDYENTRNDGGWWDLGTMSKWTSCPTSNEQVIVDATLNKNGGNPAAKTCTHVCLPNGKEELHCPNAQILLTKVSQVTGCAQAAQWEDACEAGQSDPGYCQSVFGGTSQDCMDSCEICWDFQCKDVAGSGTGVRGLLECNGTRPSTMGFSDCYDEDVTIDEGEVDLCPADCKIGDYCLCPYGY